MKAFVLVVFASATAFFTGCVSPMTIAVSDASPVRPTYDQGVAVLKSQKQNAVVVRLLTEEFSKVKWTPLVGQEERSIKI